MKYLWHYAYDGNHAKVCCNRNYIQANCLSYVKTWKPRGIRHRITWYYHPLAFAFPADNKFENIKWQSLLAAQGSNNRIQSRKVVCFGPVLPEM
jgi:hypothetical protein